MAISVTIAETVQSVFVSVAEAAGEVTVNVTETVQSVDVSVAGGGGAAATWGTITGTLASQTDLQTALDGKQPLDPGLTALSGLSTVGMYYLSAADTWSPVTIGANLTFSGGTLSAGAGGSVAWGAITGTLSAQTDLQTALDGKQPIDADLTTIAGLTATTDNFLQAKAGAWASRTVAQVKTDLGLTGTNSGDQTITLTGDVTGSGTGSFAATIAAGSVTLAKMAGMATSSLIYRKTAGTGAPEVNTLATLKTDLGLTGANSGDQTITLTGDVTGTGTASFAATLATVNSNVGSFGSATSVGTFTVNGKGLVTAAGSTAIAIPSSAITDFNSASRAQTEAELVAGTNVTITPSGTGATRQLTIAASGGGSLTVQDEGVTLSTAVTSINFTGAGVTATGATSVTVNIPGGGGGSLTDGDYGDITVSGSGTVMTIDPGVGTGIHLAMSQNAYFN